MLRHAAQRARRVAAGRSSGNPLVRSLPSITSIGVFGRGRSEQASSRTRSA